jgi:subtilisin-like proprotein convertase family protein
MNRTLITTLLILVMALLGAGLPAPAAAAANGTTHTASPNIAIPDQGAAIHSQITVPAGTLIEDLMVTVNIAHRHSSDLRITLSHAGQQVRLLSHLSAMNGFGCSADGLMVSFADAAERPLAAYECSNEHAVVTGLWKAEDPLSSFMGQDAGGVWELSVRDVVPNDNGTLRDWSITLNATDPTVAAVDFGYALINHGEVLIRTTDPIPAYTTAQGQIIRDGQAQELWLPNDADGSGFDTYVVADVIRTEDDGTWLGLFLGAENWAWVRMEDVIPTTYIDGSD